MKQITLYNVWMGFIQSVEEIKRERLRFPEEEGILCPDCLWTQAATSALACPEDFVLVSPHNQVSQFLKNKSASLQPTPPPPPGLHPTGSVSLECSNTDSRAAIRGTSQTAVVVVHLDQGQMRYLTTLYWVNMYEFLCIIILYLDLD